MSLSAHELQIIKLFREHFGDKPIIGVDLGTGWGTKAEAFLSLDNLKLLWSIDPYQHQEGASFGSQTAYSLEDTSDRMHIAATNILAAINDGVNRGLDNSRVMLCFMNSDQAFEVLCRFGEVDFVWIDGNHTKEQAGRDIANYRTIVKQGGLIGGHDYYYRPWDDLDVKGAVDEAFASGEVVFGDAHTWWVKIPSE